MKPTRNRRHIGICKDAETLGVSRVHLLLCIQGKRRSPKLLAKYAALIETRRKADPHAASREILDAGLTAAEALLPRFKAAGSDEERAAICGELAAQLPPDFDGACQRLRLVMSLREISRYQAALMPFLSALLPKPAREPGERTVIEIGSAQPPSPPSA